MGDRTCALCRKEIGSGELRVAIDEHDSHWRCVIQAVREKLASGEK